MVPPQVIQGILSHVNQHIMLLQMASTVAMAQQLMVQAQAAGVPVTPDQISPIAIQHASKMLSAPLQQIMQQVGMIQQKLQARMPPPPMDPQAQAAIQVAKMDTDRKAKFDDAMIGLKTNEQQAKQQKDAAQLQADAAAAQFQQAMDQQAQQFAQFMERSAAQQKLQADANAAQLELIRNAQTNKSHQITELLKNRDDNSTAVVIEGMKQNMATMQQILAALSPSIDNQLAQTEQ